MFINLELQRLKVQYFGEKNEEQGDHIMKKPPQFKTLLYEMIQNSMKSYML